MLPFSNAVDIPNTHTEDHMNVIDSDPPPTTREIVDTPLSLSETPQWSILSEVVTYPASPSQGLAINPIQSASADLSGPTNEESAPPPREELTEANQNELHFCPYDGITSVISSATKHDEMADVSTTFLGPIDVPEKSSFLPEYSFPFDPKSTTEGILPNGEKFKILIDTGATCSYLAYTFYLESEYLHSLPKYTPALPHIYMGNGEWTPALFIVPVTFNVGNCAFEVYTLVCRMMSSDFIWGMKNIVETEGILCSRTMSYKFLNRSPRLLAKHAFDLPPDGSQQKVELNVEFPKELSGQAVIKLLLAPRQSLQTIKAPIIRNTVCLQISNHSKALIHHDASSVVGLVDVRSLGYFHVGMDQLKRNILKHYRFRSLQNLNYHFNRMIDFVNTENRSRTSPMNTDPFPWLDPKDPRRHLTDEQILDNTIDLSNSCLTSREKRRLMAMIKRYKKAFSLRDEIGECPNITLNIDVIDDSPFFVRPFPINEKDKPLMDRQMNRLVALGILSVNNTSHTSPVMLITRKVTRDKRPVVDFRLLNTRIRRRNTVSPLLKDIFNILGNSRCEVISCVDIKDAFHSIKLNEKSKEFCGILPYFSSTHYRYEVLPMGLAISPAAWLTYVNIILDTFGADKKSFIAIMDDLLIHSSRKLHFGLIEKLLQGLCLHGLKLSPKKSQLFKTELTYMGNVFTIDNCRMMIKPLRTRLEAIERYSHPKTVKECKSFCGVINYLSLFCKDLQKRLHPIYHLTRKDVPFRWTEVQEDNFLEIKKRLCKSPILALPTADGRFILYSDTSCTHAGSALWQIQEGHPRLIGYASKTLPQAARNYSVTELEMTDLLMNIHACWTQDTEIDVTVDHKAVVQIMKSKDDPVTDRVKTLIRKLSPLPFNLYYVKGKDLVLTDFLSCIRSDDSNPEEVLPISFVDMSMNSKPPEYHLDIRTRSAAKRDGDVAPAVHGHDKLLDPHKKPEHQPHLVQTPQPLPKTPPNISPPKPPVKAPPQASDIRKPTPAQIVSRRLISRSIKTLNKPKLTPRQPMPPSEAPLIPQFHPLNPITPVPAYVPPTPPKTIPPKPAPVPTPVPTPTVVPKPNVQPPVPRDTHNLTPSPAPKPPPKTPVHLDRDDTSFYPPAHIPDHAHHRTKRIPVDQNTDLGIPLSDYRDLIDLIVRRPLSGDLDPLVPLTELIDVKKLNIRDLPKQEQLDPLLKVIEYKVLRQIHLPTSFRDLHGAYLHSPHFRDIYLHLLQNKTPHNARRRSQVIVASADYMLLDGLLFKITRDRITKEYKPLLCIPTSKVEMLLHYFHSSLMGGHMGITKTYLTLSQRFFCPNLAHHVRAFIIGCHVCQTVKTSKHIKRPFQKRININVPALCKISMDIKHMPHSQGYSFVLVMICEVSNFLVVAPLRSAQTMPVCTAIRSRFIAHYGPPTHIISNQDPAFVSSLAQAFFQHFGVRLLTVSPSNHKSLLAEHGIKSLAEILKCHLSGLGPTWPDYLDFAMLCYNSYSSPNLDGLCPFELVFGRKPNVLPLTEALPEAPVTGTFSDYYAKLREKLDYMRRHLVSFHDKRSELVNKDKQHHGFFIGQVVYVLLPGGSSTETGSQKVRISCVGPLVIMNCLSPTQFELMTLDKQKFRGAFEETMLRPGWLRTPEGPVNNLADYLRIMQPLLKPHEGATGIPESWPALDDIDPS